METITKPRYSVPRTGMGGKRPTIIPDHITVYKDRISTVQFNTQSPDLILIGGFDAYLKEDVIVITPKFNKPMCNGMNLQKTGKYKGYLRMDIEPGVYPFIIDFKKRKGVVRRFKSAKSKTKERSNLMRFGWPGNLFSAQGLT